MEIKKIIKTRKKEFIVVGIFSFLFLLIILSSTGIFKGGKPLSAGVSSVTPIFCNDYEFTCCGGKPTYSNPSIFLTSYYQCPYSAYKCTVSSVGVPSGFDWYVGKGTCSIQYPALSQPYGQCSSEIKRATIMSPGDYLYIRSTAIIQVNQVTVTAQVKITNYQLGFCGRSGAVGEDVTCGVPVSGADGCKFNPTNGKVYTSTNSLSGLTNVYSYTVPLGNCVLAFQSGDRHVCGYKEESCSSDSECTGHTFGDKECTGRTLQTYGCASFGNTIVGGDRSPSDMGWGSDAQQSSSNTFGKRCNIISAQTVQCCGDTDCGTNMVCDTSTFTCKQANQVQCTTDNVAITCGVSQICDWTTKQMKKPICSSGRCDYKTDTVECCLDVNCPTGYYCNAEKKCTISQVAKQSCIKECCVNDPLYFDRACPSDKPNCLDGTCSAKPAELSKCESCDAYAINVILGWMLPSKRCEAKTFLGIQTQGSVSCVFSFIKLIAVPVAFLLALLVGFSLFSKFDALSGKGGKAVAWVISAIVAVLLSVLVYFLFWVGIIILVIYLILRFVMGSFLRR